MIYRNKKSRKAIPGYTLIPKGEHHQVRKIGLSSKQTKTSPAFKMTRALAKDFTMVTTLGKIIRCMLLEGTIIPNRPEILNSILTRVLQTDKTNKPGNRSFLHANFQALDRLQFNKNVSLDEVLKFHFSIRRNKEGNLLAVNMPSFIASQAVERMAMNTHFRICCNFVRINLVNFSAISEIRKTTIIPWKKIKIPAKKILFGINDEPHYLHLLAVTVEWYASRSPQSKLIKRITSNPLTIIKVMRGKG